MEEKYIKILAELSEHGIEQQIDIRDFIIKLFKNVNPKEVHDYLEHMVLHRHIRFNYNQFSIYPDQLICAITLEGSEYFTAHFLKEATLRSLKSQFWYNFITWIIAFVSVSTTIYTTIQNTDLNQKLKDLDREVQQLKSLQHSKVAMPKKL